MESFQEYAPVILTVALLLVLLLLVVLLVMNRKLVKNLVTHRFSFHDLKEVDRDTGREEFSVIIANRSLNDIAIAAMGVVSGLKFFDFQRNFREQNRIAEDTKPVIPQRASIKLTIAVEELERLVFRAAAGGKLGKTAVYVIDSSGNLSKVRAKNFHKILRTAYAEECRRERERAKREGFEETKEHIRAAEARGEHVGFGERVKLVFARFPKQTAQAPAARPAEPVAENAPEETVYDAAAETVDVPEAPEDLAEVRDAAPEAGEEGLESDDAPEAPEDLVEGIRAAEQEDAETERE